MAGEWLVRLDNFENLNVVLLLNFIFVSENHITVVAVWPYRYRHSQLYSISGATTPGPSTTLTPDHILLYFLNFHFYYY